jgi:hypothetical protein
MARRKPVEPVIIAAPGVIESHLRSAALEVRSAHLTDQERLKKLFVHLAGDCLVMVNPRGEHLVWRCRLTSRLPAWEFVHMRFSVRLEEGEPSDRLSLVDVGVSECFHFKTDIPQRYREVIVAGKKFALEEESDPPGTPVPQVTLTIAKIIPWRYV